MNRLVSEILSGKPVRQAILEVNVNGDLNDYVYVVSGYYNTYARTEVEAEYNIQDEDFGDLYDVEWSVEDIEETMDGKRNDMVHVTYKVIGYIDMKADTEEEAYGLVQDAFVGDLEDTEFRLTNFKPYDPKANEALQRVAEEKPNYRVTFHDGPTGHKNYDIDIYAKDSDEAFRKAYKKFKDTFGDEPRYKGYTDATTSEIPTGPTDIGIEFSYIDHGRNDRKGTQYMVIHADSEKDAVDIYNKTYRGKKFYQPWPHKIDPDGNCTYSDVKSTYFV